MLSDLAALTPPALVCAAFLVGVIAFIRREMGGSGKRSAAEDDDEARDVSSDNKNLPDLPGGADADQGSRRHRSAEPDH
jgi:hypothetical protein